MLSPGGCQVDCMRKHNADESTPTYLDSAVRVAAKAVRATFDGLQSSRLVARIGVVVFLSFQLVACTDATAPRRAMDKNSVEAVMPALTDARRRLASGIVDITVRQKLSLSLSSVEIALRSDDVQGVETALSNLSDLLGSYEARTHTDKSEVSAIFLVMNVVSRVAAPESPTTY